MRDSLARYTLSHHGVRCGLLTSTNEPYIGSHFHPDGAPRGDPSNCGVNAQEWWECLCGRLLTGTVRQFSRQLFPSCGRADHDARIALRISCGELEPDAVGRATARDERRVQTLRASRTPPPESADMPSIIELPFPPSLTCGQVYSAAIAVLYVLRDAAPTTDPADTIAMVALNLDEALRKPRRKGEALERFQSLHHEPHGFIRAVLERVVRVHHQGRTSNTAHIAAGEIWASQKRYARALMALLPPAD